MKKYYLLFLLSLSLLSCGYPDVDDVPDFKDIKISDDELIDYCSSTNSRKINIDNCINNYKSNNKL